MIGAVVLGLVWAFTGRIGFGSGSRFIFKPSIPVLIIWRETRLPGNTQVARITPKADAPFPIRVMVEVRVSASGQKKTQEALLERFHVESPLEIGVLEGHQFVPGDTITIQHRGYRPVTATCGSDQWETLSSRLGTSGWA